MTYQPGGGYPQGAHPGQGPMQGTGHPGHYGQSAHAGVQYSQMGQSGGPQGGYPSYGQQSGQFGYGYGHPPAPKGPLPLRMILSYIAGGFAVVAFLLGFMPGAGFYDTELAAALLLFTAAVFAKAGHKFGVIAAALLVSVLISMLCGMSFEGFEGTVGWFLMVLLTFVAAATAVGLALIELGVISDSSAASAWNAMPPNASQSQQPLSQPQPQFAHYGQAQGQQYAQAQGTQYGQSPVSGAFAQSGASTAGAASASSPTEQSYSGPTPSTPVSHSAEGTYGYASHAGSRPVDATMKKDGDSTTALPTNSPYSTPTTALSFGAEEKK